jgi:hypothetical protein
LSRASGMHYERTANHWRAARRRARARDAGARRDLQRA